MPVTETCILDTVGAVMADSVMVNSALEVGMSDLVVVIAYEADVVVSRASQVVVEVSVAVATSEVDVAAVNIVDCRTL